MDTFHLLNGLCLGVGLAAACGFRVFVPLLAMSIAARSGNLHLAQGFSWMGSDPAIFAFGVATAVEIAGYYVPFIDHLLDTIATPAAGIAGTVATASLVGSMDPMMQWGVAAIAGGGAAMTVQSLTIGTRAASTVTTGGLGNPVVSTVEAGASTGLSVVAIVVPVLAAAFVILILAALIRLVRRRRGRGRREPIRQIAPQPDLPGGT